MSQPAHSMPEFRAFDPIPRLARDCVITEKIDGTNGVVYIGEDGLVIAGSRSRWLVDGNDNFGFAAWVKEHECELRGGLGAGTHFGEWWGHRIQRGYDLPKGDRRWSLFNVQRWGENGKDVHALPECCSVVPVLFRGPFSTSMAETALVHLEKYGSVASPGFDRPEGIVVFHAASRALFKKTIGRDGHKTPRKLAND